MASGRSPIAKRSCCRSPTGRTTSTIAGTSISRPTGSCTSASATWIPRGNPTGSAQDLAALKAKILRFDPTTEEIESQIVGYGLKNPWRFTIMPSASIIVPDVGCQTWEELNLLQPEAPTPANLGWNLAEGRRLSPRWLQQPARLAALRLSPRRPALRDHRWRGL